MINDIRIVRDYPHARTKVWKALTDPKLMALWGMRPEGFAPTVGTKFRLVGKPNRAWRGFVECEVTEAREQEIIAYTWIGNQDADVTHISYELADIPDGTKLTLEHTGFKGISSFFFTSIFMKPGLKQVTDNGLPHVLADLDDNGVLKPDSALKPMFREKD
jgi:uncharacterized protein YndB with AHSA1/START domain